MTEILRKQPRGLSLHFIFLATLLVGAIANADPAPSPTSSSVPPEKKTLQYYFNYALQGAFDDLKLGGNERKFFDNEALPDAITFVANYKTTSDGTDVQVDKNKLSNFLKYSSDAFATTASGKPLGCVVVRSTSECVGCDTWRAQLSAAIQGRLERRGFAPKAAPQLPEEYRLTGERAAEDVASRAVEVSCDTTVYSEFAVDRAADAPDADEPTGDLRLKFQNWIFARDKKGRRVASTSTGSVVVGRDVKPQLLTVVTTRVLADLYAGAMGSVNSQGSGMSVASERFLRVEGLNTFELYETFKDRMESAVTGLTLIERLISPGTFVFEVGSIDFNVLVRTLKAADLSPKRVDVLGATQDELRVVLR